MIERLKSEPFCCDHFKFASVSKKSARHGVVHDMTPGLSVSQSICAYIDAHNDFTVDEPPRTATAVAFCLEVLRPRPIAAAMLQSRTHTYCSLLFRAPLVSKVELLPFMDYSVRDSTHGSGVYELWRVIAI